MVFLSFLSVFCGVTKRKGGGQVFAFSQESIEFFFRAVFHLLLRGAERN